jgi:ATPase subunit of ABC transporter with duplicated ATPase domains
LRESTRARLSPGYSVGILLQEPPLNESKTVLGNVEEGAGEIKAKLDRYNADRPGDG